MTDPSLPSGDATAETARGVSEDAAGQPAALASRSRRKRHRPGPRRAANLPDVAALSPPDGNSAFDSAFVTGGAVYSDPYRARGEAADDGSDAEVTHRIGEAERSPHVNQRRRIGPTRRRADRSTMLDPGMTGPIGHPIRPDDDGGPSTAVGLAPPGAEAWHRDRTARRDARRDVRRRDPAFDRDDEDVAENDFADLGPEVDPDDHPAGLPAAPRRRARSAAPSAGQAWAAVVAQWIAGAIGGAALWVGFRFLWRDLPVVALAAAVLVTVGLVLVVRAVMHTDDRRTTLFAVLVGLLLTVSPAILVLLGR